MADSLSRIVLRHETKCNFVSNITNISLRAHSIAMEIQTKITYVSHVTNNVCCTFLSADMCIYENIVYVNCVCYKTL